MKQVPLIIWFTYYFTSITYGQSNGHCACENPFIQILEYTDAKNQLVVCGTKSDSDSLIFELTVFDCLRDSFLLDFRFDEIFPHSVKQIHDGFVITDYHFAPIGDDWKLSLLPFSEITYTFTTNGELTKIERLIFNYPKLSFKQQNDIKLLCHKLKSYQGKPKL
ncbi:MAG TPA: hypothetical protein VKZ44_08105, partial [Taishania sp.]|nr:hypothetical protein [Taishania sp.]